MNKTIYILTLLAVIITTLSQTVSIFSGEHEFYQTVQDKCVKCHGDIKTQVSTSTQHSTYSCIFCHTRSDTEHANNKPNCQDCHIDLHLNDIADAHSDFAALGSEGCLACHTTYNVIVNYSRPEYIEYNITDVGGEWIVSNLSTTGTIELSLDANREGGNHNVKNVSCQDCHQDIFSAVAAGGHAVVLDKDGSLVSIHDKNRFTTMKEWCLSCHNPNNAQSPTVQHSARKITCEGCHGIEDDHPGNFFVNIESIPKLYRSNVCISCKSIGWQEPNSTIHFRVRQEPYYNVEVT